MQTKVLIYSAIMEPLLQLNYEFPAPVLILGVKRILEKNQYPPSFYEPIIKQTLDSIVGEVKHPTQKSSSQTHDLAKSLCSSSFEENAPRIMYVRFTKSMRLVPFS